MKFDHASGPRVICSGTYTHDSKEVCQIGREASNCVKRSVDIVDGTPKIEIQQSIKIQATISAVMSSMGTASGHLLK